MRKMRKSRFFEMNEDEFVRFKRIQFYKIFKPKCFLCGKKVNGDYLGFDCFSCNLRIDTCPNNGKGVFIWKFSDFAADGVEEKKLSKEDIKRMKKTRAFQ